MDDKDRKQLFNVLLQHPLLQTKQEREALFSYCHLGDLIDEIDPHQEDVHKFVFFLLAQLIKEVDTAKAETPRLVSVLNFLIDFSSPDELTPDDQQLLLRLVQEYSKKPVRKRSRTSRSTKGSEAIVKDKTPYPNHRSQEMRDNEIREEQQKQSYLRRIINDLEWLEITGLPAGIVAQSAPLEEVFIPLQFRPNRPLKEYPLTERELATYYQSLKEGKPQPALERIVFEAERDWSTKAPGKSIELSRLWLHLEKKRPAAVIQGYPGAGKSTLLRYLALLMARSCLEPGNTVSLDSLAPPLIPFLVNLGEFALARATNPEISLSDYFLQVLKYPSGHDFGLLLDTCLQAGRALILLDGLDEVSDLKIRQRIQIEIKQFISSHSDILGKNKYFNRFIITSRIAGYDQGAFPHYPHFTIAELKLDQIEDFLPRWCRAIVRLDPAFSITDQIGQRASFEQEVEKRTTALQTTIRNRPELQTLVENPLLLTLLALMQQNQIEIPRQRVDLYRIYTQALLERRSEIGEPPLISESQALYHLGPIALHMQEANNGFLNHNEVMALLLTSIELHEGTADVRQNAETFLYKMRVHVGIFLLRAGDYYAFLHPTFREYFAARFLIHLMTLEESTISTFVENVCQDYGTWREPFLLAVAYTSSKDIALANKMISALLTTAPHIKAEDYFRRVQIAVECLIEAHPASIDLALERNIAEQLLRFYTIAYRNGEFEECNIIEDLVQKWLLSLPEHAYYVTILDVLREAINNAQPLSNRRAMLTLIAVVIEMPKPWPSVLLTTLLPSLLSLAGLSAIGPYEPSAIESSSDVAVADLALISLSLLRMQGPAGLLPSIVRQYFVAYPERLHILAQHSVMSKILLTPTLIPRKDEFSHCWPGDIPIRQWLSLRDEHNTNLTEERKVRICLKIHQDLLDYAEEMRYPLTLHIQRVLAQAEQHPDILWQFVWQDYLTDQMNLGQYISYQECALFWTLLFPNPDGLESLAKILREHLDADGMHVQRYAERFLATLADNMRIEEELEEIGEIDEGTFLERLRFWLDVREVLYIQNVQNLRYWRYLRDMHNLQHLQEMQGERPLHCPQPIQELQRLLFTSAVTQRCLARQNFVPLGQDEYADILTILLGRVLFIWKTGASDRHIEEELLQIAQAIRLDIPLEKYDERSVVVLDILRYLRFLPVQLPTRTVEEVYTLLRLAKSTDEEWLQKMCETATQLASSELLAAAELLQEEVILTETKEMSTEKILTQLLTKEDAATLPLEIDLASDAYSSEVQDSQLPAEATLTTPGEGIVRDDYPMCDVCVICALSEEAIIFMKVVESSCNKKFAAVFGPQSRRIYHFIEIENKKGETLTIYVTCLPSYGPEETGLHLKPVLAELKPRFAAMTGICAGDREKVALGDIVVAEYAFLSDTGKILLDGKGRKQQQPETRTWHPHQNILQFVRLFEEWKTLVKDLKRPISKRQQHDWLLNTLLQPHLAKIDNIPPEELQRHAPQWKKIMHELQAGSQPYLSKERALIDSERVSELFYQKDDFPYLDPQHPVCHVAPMASGSTVRSDYPFEEIRKPVRTTIAIDMEGAVFYRTIADFPGLHSLLVKGVCDYADPDKDDTYHEYASAVSANYVLALIREYVTKDLTRATPG